MKNVLRLVAFLAISMLALPLLAQDGKNEPDPGMDDGFIPENETRDKIYGHGDPRKILVPHLDGMRFGTNYIGNGKRLTFNGRIFGRDINIDQPLNPVMTQFGWQFEKQFIPEKQSGIAVVTEYIFLVGGLEQSLFIPSGTMIVGVRGSNGMEVGVGPNLSLNGVGLVVGGGLTKQMGGINFPFNIAASLSKDGTTYSLITGFSF
jgi:hypothetical protein